MNVTILSLLAVVGQGAGEPAWRVLPLESPYQAGRTEVRVLLPAVIEEGRRYPVVYVLPVEAGNESRYGDGLREIHERGLHTKYGIIFAAPTFSQLPWYADHPSDPMIRQESHFVQVVVPMVEKAYPAMATREGRLLLGFSKSGWGAWTLLLRHPELFSRAAAWDAPLAMDRLGKYGTTEIIGTQENFEQYRIADLLCGEAPCINASPRLILTGYGNFREHHEQTHKLLVELNIPHEYRDGPPREHNWHSGWVAEAVELLLDGRS